MNFSIGSHHYHVSLLLLCIGALALAAWFSRAPTITDDAATAWVQVGDKYRWTLRGLSGQVAAHLHHEARLARDTTRLRQTLAAAQAHGDSLARVADSLHQTALAPAVRRIGEACGEAIDTCERRAGLYAQALETEHAKVNLMGERLAGADTVIAGLRRATQCKFLFLHCPSRTKVAELAAIVGFALGVVAH